jgi:nitroimidazol reductase NimA-like FMN-containing flavoprotein (pyridoxamine 5'-phosphate oxidase superfamily)
VNAPWLQPIAPDACLDLLRAERVGRIAVVVDEGPIILPVNYRLVDAPSGPLIALRTRPGNVIEHAPESVAFEIDGIDNAGHEGWSVLVRGRLLHATPNSSQFRELYDPDSWLAERDAWILVEPWVISGRRLHGQETLWHYRPGEYV